MTKSKYKVHVLPNYFYCGSIHVWIHPYRSAVIIVCGPTRVLIILDERASFLLRLLALWPSFCLGENPGPVLRFAWCLQSQELISFHSYYVQSRVIRDSPSSSAPLPAPLPSASRTGLGQGGCFSLSSTGSAPLASLCCFWPW